MDNKGQMMVWEVIFFASIVILSLLFIYQLSPTSVVSDKYSNDLKIQGDTALYALYNDVVTAGGEESNYRFSKIVHYLITNAYGSFISDLNNLLPSTVMYNIYIEAYIDNETKHVFWGNSFGGYDDALSSIDPVTVSHCIVAIHPSLLIGFSHFHYMTGKFTHDGLYPPPIPRPYNEDSSDLYFLFLDSNDDPFSGSEYEVILEMWHI